MKADPKFSSWEDAIQWLRAQPSQHELVRNAFYDDPLSAAALRYWQCSEWREVQSLIGAGCGRSALDIGAGRGIASYALAKDGFSVTALEPDSSNLVGAGAIRALASLEQLDIHVVQEVSERLPFGSASFDIIFARAVLHHMDDLRAACNEIFRVLKPGGMLVAVREHVLSRAEHLHRFLELHPLHKLYGGENAYRGADYLGALVDAGFSVVTLKSFDSPINYYPHTNDVLRDKLIGPLRRVPLLGAVAKSLISPKPLFTMVLRLMSWADQRPGRLYSFICRKPA
jgi:ubiquinone/menaquinone biosynthesis C-methylase UbiE